MHAPNQSTRLHQTCTGTDNPLSTLQPTTVVDKHIPNTHHTYYSLTTSLPHSIDRTLTASQANKGCTHTNTSIEPETVNVVRLKETEITTW